MNLRLINFGEIKKNHIINKNIKHFPKSHTHVIKCAPRCLRHPAHVEMPVEFERIETIFSNGGSGCRHGRNSIVPRI